MISIAMVSVGRAARYANNKIHPGSAPYGYRVVDNVAESYPTEALWVKRIFDWYLAGVSYNEIRRRLIAGGAPQRQGTSYGKGKVQIVWQKGILQKVLRNEVYATGKMSVKMSTRQHFTLTLPPLISPLMWERTLQRREKNKSHPLHHVKYDYLFANLYREKLRAGADFLNGVPSAPEAAAEQFALRRELVESIVDRLEVDADKYAHVTFIFDFSEIGTVVSQDNSILREFVGGSSLKDFKLWEAR